MRPYRLRRAPSPAVSLAVAAVPLVLAVVAAYSPLASASLAVFAVVAAVRNRVMSP